MSAPSSYTSGERPYYDPEIQTMPPEKIRPTELRLQQVDRIWQQPIRSSAASSRGLQARSRRRSASHTDNACRTTRAKPSIATAITAVRR
jgi:hypothetical protein